MYVNLQIEYILSWQSIFELNVLYFILFRSLLWVLYFFAVHFITIK